LLANYNALRYRSIRSNDQGCRMDVPFHFLLHGCRRYCCRVSLSHRAPAVTLCQAALRMEDDVKAVTIVKVEEAWN